MRALIDFGESGPEFLDHPDDDTDRSVLAYYVTEFNNQSKLKLHCLVGTYQDGQMRL
jgi:hypothetical protein